jgi:P4 family phage/plasmid primase-like protien
MQQALSQSLETLKIALDYHAANIAILPIQAPVQGDDKTGKKPLIKNWPSRQLSAEDLVKNLTGEQNIGVVCGRKSKLVCIDIDARHGGLRWFFESEADLGHFLRESTGDGGFHLYFRYPADVPIVPSCDIAPGVAVKADGGHQVVTWPSIHWTGKQYTFEHGLSLLDLESEADELPDWLLQLALTKSEEPAPIKQPLLKPIDDPRELERAIENLKHLGPAIEKQHGDLHTFRAACIGLNYGLSPKTWWPRLREWNRTCVPPWDEKELAKKLAGAYKYKAKDLGQSAAATAFEPVGEVPSIEPKKLNKDESAAQDEELGIDQYPHTNPVKSGLKFLSELDGYLYANESDHIYENNCWHLIPSKGIHSRIWKTIVKTDPDKALKDSHVREIHSAISNHRYSETAEYDKWEDERQGNFVRVENGILDLDRAKLLDHNPAWFSCTKLPFAFEPDARCPQFESFLKSVWSDTPDQIEALQIWLGYMLTSRTDQQAFLLLFGPPGAGKGTIIEVMCALVGKENYHSSTISKLAKPFGLGAVLGKKALFIPDAHEGDKVAMSVSGEIVKNITGEDPVPVERKFRDEVSVKLTTKIVMAANDMPRLLDIQGALMRRMVVLRFVRQFRDGPEAAHQKDPDMREKLLRELPGILNWAIHGLEKLRSAGKLLRPESSREIFEDISSVLNPSQEFFAEMIEYVSPHGPEKPAILLVDEGYALYRAWCQHHNLRPVSLKKFSSLVSNQFADRSQFVGVERIRDSHGTRRRGFSCLKIRMNSFDYTASFSGFDSQDSKSESNDDIF